MAQKMPRNYQTLVLNMNLRAAYCVFEGNIPPQLFYSMDETGYHLLPMNGSYTFEVKGSRHVPILGADDKRMITMSVGSKASGKGPFISQLDIAQDTMVLPFLNVQQVIRACSCRRGSAAVANNFQRENRSLPSART